MARVARVVVPETPHHITQSGVRSMDIFYKPEDYDAYRGFLQEQSERYGLRVVAYTLMPNHIHIIATPKTPESFRAVAQAHRLYTRYINFAQDIRGHLFQERFFSTPLDTPHFYAALRYVETNPMRADMVKSPYDYPYSSARKRLGVSDDALLDDCSLLEKIGNYEAFLLEQPDDALVSELREKTRTGRPCGSREFYEMIEGVTGRDLSPKKPGRKPKGKK